jgi:hypothetical protein
LRNILLLKIKYLARCDGIHIIPALEDTEAGGLQVRNQPKLHSKFKANLVYIVRPCLKKKKARYLRCVLYESVSKDSNALNFCTGPQYNSAKARMRKYAKYCRYELK